MDEVFMTAGKMAVWFAASVVVVLVCDWLLYWVVLPLLDGDEVVTMWNAPEARQ